MSYIKKYIKYKKKYLEIKNIINFQGGSHSQNEDEQEAHIQIDDDSIDPITDSIDNILMMNHIFDEFINPDGSSSIANIYKPYIYIINPDVESPPNMPYVISAEQYESINQFLYSPYIYKYVKYDDKNVSELSSLKNNLKSTQISLNKMSIYFFNGIKKLLLSKNPVINFDLPTFDQDLSILYQNLKLLTDYLQIDKKNLETQKRIINEDLSDLVTQKRIINEDLSDLVKENEKRSNLKDFVQINYSLVYCPVCLEEIKNILLQCGHMVCKGCAEIVSKTDCKCPLCRKNFTPALNRNAFLL